MACILCVYPLSSLCLDLPLWPLGHCAKSVSGQSVREACFTCSLLIWAATRVEFVYRCLHQRFLYFLVKIQKGSRTSKSDTLRVIKPMFKSNPLWNGKTMLLQIDWIPLLYIHSCNSYSFPPLFQGYPQPGYLKISTTWVNNPGISHLTKSISFFHPFACPLCWNLPSAPRGSSKTDRNNPRPPT